VDKNYAIRKIMDRICKIDKSIKNNPIYDIESLNDFVVVEELTEYPSGKKFYQVRATFPEKNYVGMIDENGELVDFYEEGIAEE